MNEQKFNLKYQIPSDIPQTPDLIRGLPANKVFLKYKES